MLMEIPLLSKKPLSDFTPAEYREYIQSLHKAPEVRVKKEVLFKWTKTGRPQITIRRKPKWLTEEEFRELCRMHGLRQNELFLHLKDRGVEVRKNATTKGSKHG